ncbi:succinate dehydrogenase, hydrophobic membrane anchor protein [Jannaschia seohaensis]|uniref:Succinate dehydrogenase hydrophobic membrane anchor subunit n=1 Tax=Jannaschia seohaensis TaxID=475081 RepID=A0A2Y9A3E5_9RHOB|nr:succinate dehydrogenase, hydrophobic membrane anchor protein [Jannaschia seohaensis]PWJ22088.1 succinate dehydrogenase / fumarate reductase membrane anchor subunit [Jannaschia seohaensis]SSA38366.1 succinate dehydrogenase / fumarate reductase membrane anchor subunit [Jannaschia seohaensis]
MAYLTDRKRVSGLGASGTGTEHHWHQTLLSVALLIMVPLFLFTFGTVLGAPYEEIVAYYSRPWPALIALATLVVGWIHFAKGVQVLIEDYVQGTARKVAIVATTCLSYGAALASVYALARLAL